MRAADGGVVDLARGERQRREAERRRGRRRRGWRRAAPEREQAERHLALGVEVEQAVQLVVDEAEHDARGQIDGGGCCEEVGEQRAVVPEAVAVGARLVLPGVAPERARASDDDGGGGHRRLARRRRHHGRPVVAGAQAAQREVVRPEVVDARLEVGERPRDQVEVDVIERAGAGGGAEVDLAARVGLAAEHARREVEEARERGPPEGRAVAGSRAPIGERGERRARRGGEVLRQRDRLQVRVDLERPRHDRPLEAMARAVHALDRVLGAVVVGPHLGELVVVHGRSSLHRPGASVHAA